MKELFREKIMIQLPEGFTVRGAKLEDVEPALELFNSWSRLVINEDEITDAAAIRTEWVSPGFDPAKDIWLVFDPNGLMVGYIEVWTTSKPPVHPWIWGRVHPDYSNLGIGTYLLQQAEERACKAMEELPADVRFAPRIGIYRQAEASKKLFEDMGYQFIRGSYRMRIDLDAPRPHPFGRRVLHCVPIIQKRTRRLCIMRTMNLSATTSVLSNRPLKKASPASNTS